MRDIKEQIQEAQKTPSRVNTCLTTIFKLQDIKDNKKILKEARKKNTL